jgi:hypothetical protein
MKLLYSYANLLAIFNHRVISGVHATINNDRRLQLSLINQTEAETRVDDAVNQAMLSVENGDVTGIAFPLNYVLLSREFGSEQQLTVNLRLPGVDRNLNILVDTGSNSLAFCNKSLAEEATDINKINYGQCNAYSDTSPCPDGSTGYYSTFYVGQVYKGSVAVYNNQGDELESMANASFTIMDSEDFYVCDSILDGIVGVAYTEGNLVVSLSEFNVSSLWDEHCKIGDTSYGECWTGLDLENLQFYALPSPLETALEQGVESGYNTAEAFGIYVDYAATIGSKNDTVIPSLGIYFGGDLALNNDFYNNGKAQVAKQVTNNCQGDDKGPLGWYQLGFNAIRVPGLNFIQSTTELCQECATCITDSGMSMIELPLTEDFCNSLQLSNVDSVDDLETLGSLSLFIDLDGADGENITLSLPLLWLTEQFALGRLRCTGTSGTFKLGLPISQYYYLAYDMGNKTVTFVELQLSNETETFIDDFIPDVIADAVNDAGYLLYQASFTTGILVLVVSFSL